MSMSIMDIQEVKRQLDILNKEVQRILHEGKSGCYKDANGLEWGPDEGTMSWRDAIAFAKGKGDGWRLPTVAELVSQFDYDKGKPRHASWEHAGYWSSSAYAGDAASAWLVRFSYGYTDDGGVSYTYRVRCVR